MVVPKAEGIEAEAKVFHDPVHGQIALHPVLVKIIDTPQFQRLRSIKQLGGVQYVYPGGCHTRFEHSIGVAHLAGELAYNLQSRQELNITEEDILCVQIAGLCHDLGHGPFSHLFDDMFIKKTDQSQENRWKHEDATVKLFDYLVEKNGLKVTMREYGLREEGNQKDLTFIKEMMNPVADQAVWPFEGRREEKSFLYEIVANKLNGIDVDKFDYLDRDCHHLGLKNTFDYCRFFLLARVCEVNGRNHICLREKDMGNLYDMFYSRYSLHRRVYQHKVTKNVEIMITDAFLKADPVLKLSEAIKVEDNIEDYIKLTDQVFGKILHSTDERLLEAREILENIHKRNLYKFVGEAKDIPAGEKTQLITELKRVLPPGSSLELHPFKFDFGKGDEDPLDKTYFYKKDDNKTGFTIPKKQRSTLLPQHFCEKKFRIYWKNTENNEDAAKMLKEAKKTFSNWFQSHRSEGTQMLSEDGSDEEQN